MGAGSVMTTSTAAQRSRPCERSGRVQAASSDIVDTRVRKAFKTNGEAKEELVLYVNKNTILSTYR